MNILTYKLLNLETYYQLFSYCKLIFVSDIFWVRHCFWRKVV
jgi:hypothetical protein